jgi:hypothetical protein
VTKIGTLISLTDLWTCPDIDKDQTCRHPHLKYVAKTVSPSSPPPPHLTSDQKQHTNFSHTTSKTPKGGIKTTPHSKNPSGTYRITNNEVKRSFEIKPSNPTQMERRRQGKGSWNRKLGWDLLKL